MNGKSRGGGAPLHHLDQAKEPHGCYKVSGRRDKADRSPQGRHPPTFPLTDVCIWSPPSTAGLMMINSGTVKQGTLNDVTKTEIVVPWMHEIRTQLPPCPVCVGVLLLHQRFPTSVSDPNQGRGESDVGS
jgi:hypothetical protein